MSSTEFKVGDVVVVREDMVKGIHYGTLLGKRGVIVKVEKSNETFLTHRGNIYPVTQIATVKFGSALFNTVIYSTRLKKVSSYKKRVATYE